MQETQWEFAEIWADTLISPPYILMLVKEKSGIFCIYNPAQNYKVIFSSDNYEDKNEKLFSPLKRTFAMRQGF